MISDKREETNERMRLYSEKYNIDLTPLGNGNEGLTYGLDFEGWEIDGYMSATGFKVGAWHNWGDTSQKFADVDEFFCDFLMPTEAELTLFELQFNVKYPITAKGTPLELEETNED